MHRDAGTRERTGRNIIRGTSGRGYDFEAYPLSAAGDFAGVACVYICARNVSATTMYAMGEDATAKDFSLGYAGSTEDLATAAREHQEAGHFQGFGYDTVLVVRIAQPNIRAEIVEDVISLHRPVLNDLLRSHQGGLRG